MNGTVFNNDFKIINFVCSFFLSCLDAASHAEGSGEALTSASVGLNYVVGKSKDCGRELIHAD